MTTDARARNDVETADEKALLEDIAARRAARTPVPFGGTVQKLAYAIRPGYHRHWFNDTSDNVSRAETGGYSYVKDAKGAKVQRVVGVDQANKPMTAYLMEIPEVLWQEDLDKQQRRVDEVDATIKNRAMLPKDGPESEDANFYVPDGRKAAVTTRNTVAKISR